MATQCTVPIWVVLFKKNRLAEILEQKVAAWTLEEILTHFTKEAIEKITKIEKTKDEITFWY